MSLSLQNKPMTHQRFAPSARFAGASNSSSFAKLMSVWGNYIDQASIVQKSGRPVNWMMITAASGVTGYHAWKAQPEERKKVITRDALVLSAAVGGTMFAAGGLAAFRQLFNSGFVPTVAKDAPVLKKFILQGAKPLHDEGEKLAEHAKEYLKKIKGGDEDKIHSELQKFLEEKIDKLKDDYTFSRDELGEIYDNVKKYEPEKVSKIFTKLFSDDDGLGAEVKEAMEFFGIGLAGVLSGIGGGLLANKINELKDPEKTPDMVKEGIFQFVANIGMCAVGAGSALALMSPDEWAPKISEKLRKPAEKVTEFFHESAGSKVYRFGGVLAGLSVGILGGAHIANYVGRHYVNPVLDKIQGKESKPPEEQEKRHIEGMDMVLHVDDIPTAAAIAGTAILGPWIMPFFPVSGYRAGIGYRNDEKAKQKNKPEAKTPQVNTTNSANSLAQSSGLVPQMMNAPQLAFGMPFGQQGGFQNPFHSGQRFQGLKSQGAKADLN